MGENGGKKKNKIFITLCSKKKYISLLTKEEKMETGKVKFYNREKRYGFVTGDDGTDYFFHESMLAEGQQVRDEDRVEFNATDGDRGKQATDISRID